MKWKLDRASYYPLIATALNKSERARAREERERERERTKERK